MVVQLAAVPVAVIGQLNVTETPPVSVGCFVFAILLTVIAQHELPPEPDLPAGPRVRSREGRVLLWLGWALCVAAAPLVLAERIWQAHAIWFAGLAVLASSALVYSRAQRSPDASRIVRDRRVLLAYLGLAVLAGVLFAWNLQSIPVEVHGDDAEVGNDAIELISRRPLNLFRTGWYELPIFHAAPTAVFLKLFGINLFALRATSVALGVGTVLLLFGVVRRLWDLPTALLAAALLAANSFFIHLSRAGYHYVDTPFFSVLVLWLFVRVWSSGSAAAAVWCGVALGLGVQTYPASRLVPLLLSLTWAAWWIAGLRAGRQGGATSGSLGGERPWTSRGLAPLFAIVAGTALAVAAPIGAHFVRAPHELWFRAREVSIFSESARRHLAAGYGTDSVLEILGIQLRAALTLFHATVDTSVQYGLEAPLLDSVAGVLFALGVGVSLARGLRPREVLVLVWLAFPVVTGGALTIDTPFYPRVAGAVPFAALAAALGLRGVLRAAFAGGAGGSRLRAAVTAAATIAVIGAVLAINARRYFVEYAPHYRHSPALEIAGFVRARAAGRITYMIGGWPQYSIRHGAVRFLAHGQRMIDIENPRWLENYNFEPARSAFIVMARREDLLRVVERRVGPLEIEFHDQAGKESAFFAAVPRARSAPAASGLAE